MFSIEQTKGLNEERKQYKKDLDISVSDPLHERVSRDNEKLLRKCDLKQPEK